MLVKLILSDRIYDIVREDSKGVVSVLFTLFFAAVFEFVGLALIAPLLSLVTNPTSVDRFYVSELEALFGLEVSNESLFIITVCVYVFSVLFRIFATYKVIKFTLGIEAKISTRLFRNAILSPYEQLIVFGRGDQARNILSEVNHVVNGALVARLNIFAFSAVLLGMVLFLLLVSPVITIYFGGIFILVYFLIF